MTKEDIAERQRKYDRERKKRLYAEDPAHRKMRKDKSRKWSRINIWKKHSDEYEDIVAAIRDMIGGGKDDNVIAMWLYCNVSVRSQKYEDEFLEELKCRM